MGVRGVPPTKVWEVRARMVSFPLLYLPVGEPLDLGSLLEVWHNAKGESARAAYGRASRGHVLSPAPFALGRPSRCRGSDSIELYLVT